jgi:hypothetical protein
MSCDNAMPSAPFVMKLIYVIDLQTLTVILLF